MRATLGVVALALAFALATWVLGWLAVPAAALLFGAMAARDRAPLEALGAAVIAWLVLLGIQSTRGPVGQAARTLGGVVGVPGWTTVLLTLLFAAALAWSGATIGRAIGRSRPSFRRG